MNKFLDQVKLGTNKWWQYVLTIVAVIASILFSNVIIQKILPAYKALFPANQFGKDLGTLTLAGGVFGIALIVFIVAFQKLHHRNWLTLITTNNSFSFSKYAVGFITWALLVFGLKLATAFQNFENFLQGFNAMQFIILFVVGFVCIGIQSFFEEIVIRGYWLQGMSLRIKNVIALVVSNGLLFGIMHFGYGIDSFISSFLFGISFAFIVTKIKGIEYVSGAHNANNLVLTLFFIDLKEAINEKFSWVINYKEMALHIFILIIFIFMALKLFNKKYATQA